MYGFAILICFGCDQPFTCNPKRVPVCVHNGDRKPVCANCVARVNPQRVKMGLEPIVPVPGAYEVFNAEELG